MFNHICWDTVSTDHQAGIPPTLHRLHAIWPSPVDSDACFNAAGFTEFADSDDVWDSEWQAFIGDVIMYLSIVGRPLLRKPAEIGGGNSLWNRIFAGFPQRKNANLTLSDQVVLSSRDDHFGCTIIDFGAERFVTMAAGGGHPILWVFDDGLGKWSISELEREISGGHRFAQRHLNWSHLSPPIACVLK